MGAPRLGVESELQLSAYTIAIPDQSHICDLHCSLQQRQILNPLSKTRDRTRNLMVPSWICFCCTTTGTPGLDFLFLPVPFKIVSCGVPIVAQQKQIQLGTMMLWV